MVESRAVNVKGLGAGQDIKRVDIVGIYPKGKDFIVTYLTQKEGGEIEKNVRYVDDFRPYFYIVRPAINLVYLDINQNFVRIKTEQGFELTDTINLEGLYRIPIILPPKYFMELGKGQSTSETPTNISIPIPNVDYELIKSILKSPKFVEEVSPLLVSITGRKGADGIKLLVNIFYLILSGKVNEYFQGRLTTFSPVVKLEFGNFVIPKFVEKLSTKIEGIEGSGSGEYWEDIVENYEKTLVEIPAQKIFENPYLHLHILTNLKDKAFWEDTGWYSYVETIREVIRGVAIQTSQGITKGNLRQVLYNHSRDILKRRKEFNQKFGVYPIDTNWLAGLIRDIDKNRGDIEWLETGLILYDLGVIANKVLEKIYEITIRKELEREEYGEKYDQYFHNFPNIVEKIKTYIGKKLGVDGGFEVEFSSVQDVKLAGGKYINRVLTLEDKVFSESKFFLERDFARKVYTTHPAQVRYEREKFKVSYEADILYDIRYSLDFSLRNQDRWDLLPKKVWYFDIEVFRKFKLGIPMITDPTNFINSISIYQEDERNPKNNKAVIIFNLQWWKDELDRGVVPPQLVELCGMLKINPKKLLGFKKYTTIGGVRHPDKEYGSELEFSIIFVKDEEQLLNVFFNLLRKEKPDYITGWNIHLFDLPYIIGTLKFRYPHLIEKVNLIDEVEVYTLGRTIKVKDLWDFPPNLILQYIDNPTGYITEENQVTRYLTLIKILKKLNDHGGVKWEDDDSGEIWEVIDSLILNYTNYILTQIVINEVIEGSKKQKELWLKGSGQVKYTRDKTTGKIQPYIPIKKLYGLYVKHNLFEKIELDSPLDYLERIVDGLNRLFKVLEDTLDKSVPLWAVEEFTKELLKHVDITHQEEITPDYIQEKIEWILDKILGERVGVYERRFLEGYYSGLLLDLVWAVKQLRRKNQQLDGIIYKKIFEYSEEYISKEILEQNIPRVRFIGYSPVDYYRVYRMEKSPKPESYSLDYVAKLETGLGKEEYIGTLDELYVNDPYKFVLYNIVDSWLVYKINQKLNFLKLIDQLKVESSLPIEYFSVEFMVKMGDGLLIKTARNRKEKYVVITKRSLEKEKYEGAFVFIPQPDLYEFVIDLDASSLYPSTNMTYQIDHSNFMFHIKGIDFYELYFMNLLLRYIRDKYIRAGRTKQEIVEEVFKKKTIEVIREIIKWKEIEKNEKIDIDGINFILVKYWEDIVGRELELYKFLQSKKVGFSYLEDFELKTIKTNLMEVVKYIVNNILSTTTLGREVRFTFTPNGSFWRRFTDKNNTLWYEKLDSAPIFPALLYEAIKDRKYYKKLKAKYSHIKNILKKIKEIGEGK